MVNLMNVFGAFWAFFVVLGLLFVLWGPSMDVLDLMTADHYIIGVLGFLGLALLAQSVFPVTMLISDTKVE